MKKRIIVGVILLFLLIITAQAVRSINTPRTASGLKGSDTIGVIEINGAIMGSSSGSSFLQSSTANSNELMKIIREAAKRPDIKAVVVRIDSPGGTSVASQEIGVELDKLRATGKPVITSMGDVCASGGYWVACSTDHIMANAGTLTGSIGVIMQIQNIQGLYEKIGLRQVVIKSGEHKDIGSPYRELTDAEQAILQGIVQDSYQQFLDQVLRGRQDKITREELVKVADGRVLTGSQAKQLGLVDSLGDYYDAVELAKKLAGVSSEANVEVLSQADVWKKLFTSIESMFSVPNMETVKLYY